MYLHPKRTEVDAYDPMLNLNPSGNKANLLDDSLTIPEEKQINFEETAIINMRKLNKQLSSELMEERNKSKLASEDAEKMRVKLDLAGGQLVKLNKEVTKLEDKLSSEKQKSGGYLLKIEHLNKELKKKDEINMMKTMKKINNNDRSDSNEIVNLMTEIDDLRAENKRLVSKVKRMELQSQRNERLITDTENRFRGAADSLVSYNCTLNLTSLLFEFWLCIYINYLL